MIEQVAWNKSSLLLANTKVKHTIITTICNENLNRKYLQKLLKIPSCKAWAKRPNGLIKGGRKRKRINLKFNKCFDYSRE
jgi:hypothetical protein